MVLSLFPKEEDKPRFKGLTPNVHCAYNSLYSALDFGVANIYHGLNVTHWGFNTMQWTQGLHIFTNILSR